VLFAYDAVAYYLWRVTEDFKDPSVTEEDIRDGTRFGRNAKNSECDYGGCFACLLWLM